ncbi:hypothetical protein TNCV_2046201 [Trichonephila clavipes]|uniref:Uncharacterized protein n=1 Tax=Trichonephila clavipes TaxID=2585209 RepID=A0A8X6VLZ4_TRICX|nr:hypothetical protein TNCV_2046201 [Trichonephila clavipes]
MKGIEFESILHETIQVTFRFPGFEKAVTIAMNGLIFLSASFILKNVMLLFHVVEPQNERVSDEGIVYDHSNGIDSLVGKVTNSCHEFEPNCRSRTMVHRERRCTLNMSRPSCRCGVEIRARRCQLSCRPRHLTIAKSFEVHRQTASSI